MAAQRQRGQESEQHPVKQTVQRLLAEIKQHQRHHKLCKHNQHPGDYGAHNPATVTDEPQVGEVSAAPPLQHSLL